MRLRRSRAPKIIKFSMLTHVLGGGDLLVMTRRALSRRVILLTCVDLATSWARLIDDSGCEILIFFSFLTIQMCSNQFCLQEFIFFFGLTEGQPQDMDSYW